MDDDSVLVLIRGPESEQVERKERLSAKKDEVCQDICAFANDMPHAGKAGLVVIGQADGGRPTGLPITDQLLLELADLRTNGNILPFPQLSVRRLELDSVAVAVIVVEPSQSPPLQFRGRTYIRVGPSTRPATSQEELVLAERRQAGNLPFDAQPISSASISDLDLQRFTQDILPQLVAEEVLRENGRTVEQQLASLRLATAPPDSRPTPTGILVAGIDPSRHLPGAYLQFASFDGTGLSDPVLSSHQVSGTVTEIVLEAEEIVRSHIDTVVSFVGLPTEERRSSVPFQALQQLIRNAILHRSYDASNAPVRVYWFHDRVEIHSPGGPYGQVTVETIGQPGLTDYRNPTLAATLRQLGFVQRFGVGIQIAQDRLRQNGNLPLEYQASVAAVAAIVRLNT